MPFIKPIRDDFAVREIQRKQAKQTSIQAPTASQPSSGINTYRSNTPLRRSKPVIKERRRSNDRRQVERRSQQGNVYLDTRSNRDRRQGDRREASQTPEAAQRLKRRLHHIDTYS